MSSSELIKMKKESKILIDLDGVNYSNSQFINDDAWELFRNKLSHKTGVSWTPENFKNFYYLQDTFEDNSKKIELIFDSNDFPQEVNKKEGCSLTIKEMADLYVETLNEFQVKCKQGYQVAEFENGKMTFEEGVNLQGFIHYGISPSNDSKEYDPQKTYKILEECHGSPEYRTLEERRKDKGFNDVERAPSVKFENDFKL